MFDWIFRILLVLSKGLLGYLKIYFLKIVIN